MLNEFAPAEEINLNDHRHLETLQSIEVVTVVAANHTAEYREDVIVADTSTGNITVTLPKSRGGKKFCVIKASAANTLLVNFSNGETMLGITSVTITSLADRRWFKGFQEGYIPL